MANEPSLLEQLSVFLAPLAGLLGVLLGTYLGAKREEAASLRSLARDTYSRYLVTCHELTEAANDVVEAPDLQLAINHERLRRAVYELRLRSSEIQLFSPDRLGVIAKEQLRLALAVSDALAAPAEVADVRSKTGGVILQWSVIRDFEEKVSQFVNEAGEEFRRE